jgi:hypothetical protein
VFFWLCDDCSLNLTLELDADGGLTLQKGPVRHKSGFTIAVRSIKRVNLRMLFGHLMVEVLR